MNSFDVLGFVPLPNLQIRRSHSPPSGNPKFDPWYTNGNIVLTNIASLEDYLNLDPTNVARGTKYNFLSNLPDNVSTAIKNQTFPTLPPNTKPIDAFLLADSNSPNSFVADTSVDPNSIPIDIFFDRSVFDISSEQTGISQITSNNFSRPQVGTVQDSISQISYSESSHTKPSISQISSTEVGMIQTGFVEQSSSQISPTQINPFDIGLGEIQSTEVDSTQIISDRVIKVQPIASKVSNLSSIEPENLFVLQQWFIDHAFSPNSSVSVSNTLNSLWNYNLSTPFDISVEILDLPKGQLAEATITGFNDSGKPNAGTILIDHDANG
ncbi:MAG: hypothetical protein AAFV28_10465, partial [Cyanobacteria bacterium J06635_13]